MQQSRSLKTKFSGQQGRPLTSIGENISWNKLERTASFMSSRKRPNSTDSSSRKNKNEAEGHWRKLVDHGEKNEVESHWKKLVDHGGKGDEEQSGVSDDCEDASVVTSEQGTSSEVKIFWSDSLTLI